MWCDNFVTSKTLQSNTGLLSKTQVVLRITQVVFRIMQVVFRFTQCASCVYAIRLSFALRKLCYVIW